MSQQAPVPFVHLRMHTEFSLTDGMVRIKEVLGQAAADGMGAIAMTDLNNLFGLIPFYTTARKMGIKPIVGCDVWVKGEGDQAPFRVLLLARNREGYHALCLLLSQAWRQGQVAGVAYLERAAIEAHAQNLMVLSGGELGDVGMALLQGNQELALTRARAWQKVFGDAYYLEAQHYGAPHQNRLLEATLSLGEAADIAVVATHPIQFSHPDDFKAHEARVCIAQGYTLADPRRPRNFTGEQHFRTQAQMQQHFADYPQLLHNSVEIARRCNLEIELGVPLLPNFPTPDGMSLPDYLVKSAQEGLERRLLRQYPDEELRNRERPTYLARLEFECNTIIRMKFPGYFLIVADFINWAKNNGVPVGPGRGSGAGSLVAWCLGITDLDPLEYDLLFERFLNPERVSLPDFDVDFCQDGRDRVIEYVRTQYGADSVSQIATFGTMAARAVIRDVGRVLGMPYGQVDGLAKLVPMEIGITLEKARAQEPQLDQRAAVEEEVSELLSLATRLEGLSRNVGMHAGGVLIAPGKLTDFVPLYCQEGSDSVVSQFDKDGVEQAGLVKFDFLGLRTLTIIDWAERTIREIPDNPQAQNFRVADIPLDDPATYELYSSGNTTAVFQQESRTAKDLEKRIKPERFDDIIDLMALNRPGPLQSGMVDQFIERRQGKSRVDYFHQSIEPILKPTYGMILYQEQVMRIAQVLAGYSLGTADMLRKAMGKKDMEVMARQRSEFVNGSTKHGVSVNLATQLFDLMEKFGEYGFNKSHSAAYALVSYQTAWLKAHYPAHFMAATLSGDLDDTDKVAVFVNDAQANNLVVLPPDVNASVYRFVAVDDKQIRYGLGSVKGVGESAALEIGRVRSEQGPYTSLFDFCNRLDKRVVNRRVVEALIKAGAFDSLGHERSTLLTSLDDMMGMAEQMARASQSQQVSLFGEAGDDASLAPVPQLQVMPPWTLKEQLDHEKSVLGYYFSDHPYRAYQQELEPLITRSLADVAPHPDLIRVAGLVTGVRLIQTRRGRMMVATLDDGSASLEVTAFDEVYQKIREVMVEDAIVVVTCKATLDNFTQGVRLSAEDAVSVDEARLKLARCLRLNLKEGVDMNGLRQHLGAFKPGECMLRVRIAKTDASGEVELPAVLPEPAALGPLMAWLGEGGVEVLYR